jgi:hypothetical protein
VCPCPAAQIGPKSDPDNDPAAFPPRYNSAMRRLPSPFAFLWLTSGALFFVVVVAWVRSYQMYEEFSHAGRSGGAQVVRSYEGRLYLDSRSFWTGLPGWSWTRGGLNPGVDAVRVHYQDAPKGTLGFATMAGSTRTWPGHLYPVRSRPPPLSDPRWWIDRYRAVVVPYWFLGLIFVAAPALRVAQMVRVRYRGSRRARHGLCSACGYDLRATADRCPECGNMVSIGTAIPCSAATAATASS